MNDSSFESFTDEEEIFKLFEKEAKNIIHSERLSKKSADQYLLNYNAYENWKKKNNNRHSASEENNFIVYFEGLKKSESNNYMESLKYT